MIVACSTRHAARIHRPHVQSPSLPGTRLLSYAVCPSQHAPHPKPCAAARLFQIQTAAGIRPWSALTDHDRIHAPGQGGSLALPRGLQAGQAQLHGQVKSVKCMAQVASCVGRAQHSWCGEPSSAFKILSLAKGVEQAAHACRWQAAHQPQALP